MKSKLGHAKIIEHKVLVACVLEGVLFITIIKITA